MSHVSALQSQQDLSFASTTHDSVARQDYEPRCNTKHNSYQERSLLQHTANNIQTTISDDIENKNSYEAPEPFRYLHDCCDDCNPTVPESPDPLVSMTWSDLDHNTVSENEDTVDKDHNGYVGTPLQIYRTLDPVALYTIPANASVRVAPKTTTNNRGVGKGAKAKPRLLILEDCTVVMDWGSERAAWFEIQSGDDLSDPSFATVTASISEYNKPYPGKNRPLNKYGDRTYRLETNDELYEGIRFTFLNVKFPPNRNETNPTNNTNTRRRVSEEPKPISVAIDDFSIVSKIKPIAYTGSFRSSNPLLTKAWYWGAYGVRLNVERTQLNSILIERGDRVAIQGDAHPSIAAMLAVFYSKETKLLLKNELNATDNAHKRVVDDNIMAYPLYWCLSAMDYYWATIPGENDRDDEAFVQQLVDDISILLDKRMGDFLDPNLDITWFGWDDRVGNGWCFHSKNDKCTREALLAFAGLVIKVCNDFVLVLENLQKTRSAEAYRARSIQMKQALRNVAEFPSGFGVHAAANAINAGVATQDEIDNHWMGTANGQNTLNNAVTVCSFSQFNQYWILQAYGNMEGGMEHGLKSIDLCWGPMMELSTGGCFWELSSPEWLRFMKEGDQAPHLPSYCHPWASGVTPWLSKLVGGVRPLTRGYKNFVAMPYVSERYPSVTATTATPYGPIVVSANLKGTGFLDRSSLSASRSHLRFNFVATVNSTASGFFGVQKSVASRSRTSLAGSHETTIEVPLVLESLEINGSPVASHQILDDQVLGATFHNARSREYFFLELKKGANDVKATYQAIRFTSESRRRISSRTGTGTSNSVTVEKANSTTSKDVSPFPVPKYPAVVSGDRDAQGDGLFLYGQDGYSLRGCNSSTAALPKYVRNLTVIQHGYPGWVVPEENLVGYSDTNPIYLPTNKDGHKGKRVLGTVGIDDQGGGDINCILVNVEVDKELAPKKYYLSVYFVASRPGNKHAIRAMDGETYDVIAPTTLIEDYEEGFWWTLHTDRPSIRLKMMDIEGIHLSAIGFATDLSREETILMRKKRNE